MEENSREEYIKILENMNDGYTFKDCDMCNNYNEKTKCCDKHKYMELQAIEHILQDYKKLQEEFKQVDHECERLEEKEEILNKYKLALFMVIRNSMVMPQGIKLGKTDKEINEMSYETMCSVLTMINYDQAEKFYKEGNGGK